MRTEYFLVISPDENTSQRIMEEKKRFAELYKCPQIVKSKPHISLVRFFNINENESFICQYLQRKINTFSSFLLEINGFGSFPTHTIFAKIATKIQITNIVRSIKTEGKKLQLPSEESVYFVSSEPHLTLARGLQHWQYENGWKEWQHVPFMARFNVKEILLLKKQDNKTHFEVVTSLPLLGIKNEFSQASLF